MKREYDLDDDDCVKDGESVRTPLFLVDAVRFKNGEPHFVRAGAGVDLSHHQPGYRVDAASRSVKITDLDALRDAARAARSAWIRRISDSWRAPRSVVAGPGQQRQTDPSEINQSALSERRVGHEPDNGSSLAEWREHMRPDDEPDHDIDAAMARHQRARDDAWARFRDDLQNKWRTGRTDPSRATEIEKQRREWHGGR